MTYNLAPLRDLIKENLTDQEFRDLVFYHFSEIEKQFTSGMTKSEQIRLLLEYVDRYQELDYFLEKIEKERPKIFTESEYPQDSKDTLRKRVLEQSELSRIREKSFQAFSNSTPTHNTNSSLESSLLISIKQLKLGYFKIQAWFWSSEKQCPIQEPQIIEIMLDESEQAKRYQKFTEEVSELIDKSNILMRQIGSEDLRIELFLSTDLLKQDDYYFDWIEINKSGFLEKMCKQYPVVFRLAERLEVNYQDSLGDWKRKWQQIQSHNCCVIAYDQNTETLLNQPQNIGIILDQVSNIEKFFRLICLKAIPIALWSRCDLKVNSCQEINRILSSPNIIADLKQLPMAIKNERNDAQQGIEHIGHHICLLWDDPERMPPNEVSPEYSLSSI